MADEAVGDVMEAYPPEMQAIIEKAEKAVEAGLRISLNILERQTPNIAADLTEASVLQEYPAKLLAPVHQTLIATEHQLIDYHSDMLGVTTHWREEHSS